jgi:hypothetical protein
LKPIPTIVEAMADRELFQPWFSKRWLRADSWATWRVFLKSLYALPLTTEELEVFRKYTGRTKAPFEPFKKCWLVCGRRSGKSRIASLVATYNATFRKYPELQRGEVGVVPIVAADRHQADVIFTYVENFIHEIPLLAKLVVRETKDSIELSNNIRVEVQTSDHRAVRGFTIVSSCCDELAFWNVDADSASPDVETLNALEKGSANIPNSMQLAVSSPYAKAGALFEAYNENYGKDDSDELVWMADSRSMNPLLSQRTIDKAIEKDSAAALSEFGFAWRTDVAGFLTLEAIQACVFSGRYELAPCSGVTYYAFCDPSGGSSDSMTLAIAHHENGVAVLDLVREVVPPFSPESVVRDFVADAKRYRCYSVVGDRFGAGWVQEAFEKTGVVYQHSELTKSEIYLSLLPAVNSRQVELLDNKKLVSQLAGLERRTRSGGRDSVDHRGGLHDDVSNSVAGALVLAGGGVGVYGLLDYDLKIKSGEVRENEFGMPSPGQRARDAAKIGELRARMAAEHQARHSQPTQPMKPSGACIRCASNNVVEKFKDNFYCNDCELTFQRGRVGVSPSRADVFDGNAPTAKVSGPGAPGRGGKFGRFN